MRRLKKDFKPLSYEEIVKINPERKGLEGDMGKVKKVIEKGLKFEPFDKK